MIVLFRLKVRVDILKSPISQLQKNISSDRSGICFEQSDQIYQRWWKFLIFFKICSQFNTYRCPSVPPAPRAANSKGRKNSDEGNKRSTRGQGKKPEVSNELRKPGAKAKESKKKRDKEKKKEHKKKEDGGQNGGQERVLEEESADSANKSTIGNKRNVLTNDFNLLKSI